MYNLDAASDATVTPHTSYIAARWPSLLLLRMYATAAALNCCWRLKFRPEALAKLAAVDLFGDERKHPRFIHFTHLQQRSASAW